MCIMLRYHVGPVRLQEMFDSYNQLHPKIVFQGQAMSFDITNSLRLNSWIVKIIVIFRRVKYDSRQNNQITEQHFIKDWIYNSKP